MRAAIPLLLALLIVDDWKVAREDYQWSFPRDHWAHDGYRTEWWYFTGHLEAESEPHRRFGYQFTFFRIGVVGGTLTMASDWAATHVIMGHAAVTDLATGAHVFSEVLYREMPLLASFQEFPDPDIGWSLGPAGTREPWTLRWNGGGFDLSASDDAKAMRFRLSTRSEKPLVFQGPGGFSAKGDEPGAASLYYSLTRLKTEGSVTLAGESFLVSGASWMDKEFSSSHLAPDQIGWDWFSLRLDDGRDLMLYLMRGKDGTVDYASGTIVGPDGETSYLRAEDFDVQALEFWTSPVTEARYPIAWRVGVGSHSGLELEIRALVEDQENRSRLPGGVFYWEGAVMVEGDVGGEGFVELTGYGEGNRPPV